MDAMLNLHLVMLSQQIDRALKELGEEKINEFTDFCAKTALEDKIPEDYAGKLKIFKESVGEDWPVLAQNPNLSDLVDKHCADKARQALEKVKSYLGNLLGDEFTPQQISDFVNLAVIKASE